ncbi:MAG: hypothetical protein E7632_11310, partial [Ruminococcaceae bacterium]|nr:hypothetical protein [Oscillospiraceae bacterium]
MKKFVTLMLLVSLLTACGSDTPTSDTGASDTTAPAETTDDGLVHDDLGDIKFEGETFTIWLYHTAQLGYRMEEETGDVFDDAIVARNRAVEERLGITLEFTDSGMGKSGSELPQSCKMIESFILAGDTSNDVYLHCQFSSMPQLVNNHYFIDWNTIPNVELTKPYWAQKAINDINYGSKIYMMTGLYEYEIMANANCLIFNKRIFDEMQIEYPYQSVKDGTWTYDKWMQIVTDTSRDLNGDTVYDLATDQYGYAGGLWQMPYTFFVGMGGDLLTKDNDNMPVNVVTSEHNVDIIDRLMGLANDTSGAIITAETADITNAFVSGRIATTHNTLGYLPSALRDMKDDFGFVPSPKYDEEQKEYNVWISNSS